MGILNLTKAPKFDVDKPTAKANITEKTTQNNTRGFVIICLKKLIGTLIKKNKVNPKMNRFSKPDTAICKFDASQINGRNNPTIVACGNFDITPAGVFSKLPISNELPW